jgi:hypothetical protein
MVPSDMIDLRFKNSRAGPDKLSHRPCRRESIVGEWLMHAAKRLAERFEASMVPA